MSNKEAEQQAAQIWHSLSAKEVASRLDVADTEYGLAQAEAEKRLTTYGPNMLRKEKKEPFWEELLEEAKEPMILLLFVTGIFYGIIGGLEDAIVIAGVIIILLLVEVANEYRAENAIASLRKLAEPLALVRRDGLYQEILTEQVVPGDVILLEAGRRVPADARVIESHGIDIDESLLTGESGAVEKSAEINLPKDTPLAERSNLVFAGTTILRGRGAGVVVATGTSPELARIGKLASEAKAPPTLLQRTMSELTRWMVLLAVGFSVAVPLLGWLLVHEPPQQMFLTGLSLAFATIPEELPIIITIVLALGAYRLSRQRAVVKRLQAVETLGAVTVIASDKTGTLTSNRMELKQTFPERYARRIMEIGVLCNDAEKNGPGNFAGDPLDVALMEAAEKAGMDIDLTRKVFPLKVEFTFDNNRKMMSAVYDQGSTLSVTVKGAFEEVISHSKSQLVEDNLEKLLTEQEKDEIRLTQTKMASEGFRVVAFAQKRIRKIDGEISQDNAESDLVFVGLASFADPARPEVRDALATSSAAGVRTIMVTGDHPLTAISVAKEVGLSLAEEPNVLTGKEIDSLSNAELQEVVEKVSVFARATPEHKLRIVNALHSDGEVVAVTGDGINDAPALAASDIGIAMGMRGSDVARETADIVLSDDNYSTIVRSIGEGRTLFSNLTKGVRYYLACKVALVSVTLLPVLLLVPIPFAPIQIILMELFMDLAAAATFASEPAEPDVMRKRPRDPKAKFLNREMVSSILIGAAGLFIAVTAAYLVTWNNSHDLIRAQTVAFATWLVGHVFLALNMRSQKVPLIRLGLFSNKLMVVWMLVTLAFTGIVTSVPDFQIALRTAPLTVDDWALLIPLALSGTFWMEIRKWLTKTH